MPIDINAIFGIPTREEKFTTKRDAALAGYEKERLNEQEKIRQQGEEYDYAKGQKRLRSTLENSGLPPEQIDRMVAQAGAPGALGNIEKSREIMGGMPTAELRGQSAGESTLASNIASGEEAANRGLLARVLQPHISQMGFGRVLKEVAGNAADVERSETAAKEESQRRNMLARTGEPQIVAEQARLGAVPEQIRQSTLGGQQALRRGEQGIAVGDLENAALRRQDAEVARLAQAKSTLYDTSPDMLTAPLRAQGEEALTTILKSQQVRKYLQENPDAISTLMGLFRSIDPNKIGGWRDAMPGGPTLPGGTPTSQAIANDPDLQILMPR